MLKVGTAYIGTSVERAGNNFRHGDVFVETDTSQTYIYAGGIWQLMGIDKNHIHDDRYYTKNETYTKNEVNAITTSGGTVEWDNVLNKPATYPPEAHTHDDRYYTESETDTKLNDKQRKTIFYSGGGAPPKGTNTGDLLFWENTDDQRYYLGVYQTIGNGAWRYVELPNSIVY